jgi:hypothetical protein
MKHDYKKKSYKQLKEMRYNHTYSDYVEVTGIPKTVEFTVSGKEGDKNYDYSTRFFLKMDKHLVQVYNHNSKDSYRNIKEQYLRAASESNLEITVRGLFEGSSILFGYISIYWGELVIDGNVIKKDYSKKDENPQMTL